MVLVVPNAGELILLDKMIRSLSNNDADFELRVFSNSDEPTSITATGDLTEATFSGYVRKTLNRSNFLASATLGNGNAQITYDTEQVWTVGATGQQVYGYFVVERSTSNLLWVERLGATNLTSGDQLKITPSLTLRSRKENT